MDALTAEALFLRSYLDKDGFPDLGLVPDHHASDGYSCFYSDAEISTESLEVQKIIVDKHNNLRKAVTPAASNMLIMQWSNEAASNAEKWANTCSFNHSPSFKRKISTSGCGENLYMSTEPNSWEDAIQAWFDEVENFTYAVGAKNGEVVGHYTQVVWYRSNLVGCAVSSCTDSDYNYFYVCQYCPPGNYQGLLATPYNAGTPCADCPQACEEGLCNNPCPYFDKYGNCGTLRDKFGCSSSVVSWCPALCKCITEIK